MRWSSPALVLAMVATTGGIAALAYWDQEREGLDALEDFAEGEAFLAQVLSQRVRSSTAASLAALEQASVDFERAGTSLVLLRAPGEAGFRQRGGRAVQVPVIQEAIAQGRAWARIPSEQSAELGLPRRTAVAGIAALSDSAGQRIDVVIATTAARARDREHRSARRILYAVLTAGGLVLSFGGLALYRQKKELDLERELALADLARERDERLQRLDRAATLGALAIGIGHEISTPLGIISVRAEQLVSRVAGDERAVHAVSTIIDQTKRIDEVIRALLALARGDGGSAAPVEPATVVAGARGLVEHRFQEASVSLSAGVPADLPQIHGDALLLEQALVNLLLNACEACPKGGNVSVTASREDGVLGFTVLDDGVGISPEVAARATEPFFTTKSTAGGAGLGLAIVNEIVANHGGRLFISPRSPRGTSARMEIPIERRGVRHG